PYTARSLFAKVVDTLRKRATVMAEPYEVTCQKAWYLLRGFRFIGGATHDSLRVELDRWLLARVGSADRLAQTRNHLLLDLALMACLVNAQINAAEFLEWAGLSGIPLTNWVLLSRKGHDHLYGVFRRKQFDLTEDVRP